MCGRFQFSQQIDDPAMRRLLSLAEQQQIRLPEGDVAPGCAAGVLISGGDRAQLTLMQWGFPLADGGRLIINARSETAEEKRSFSRCLRRTRCAIPTTGFYEWSRHPERRQYHFTGRSGLLYLAGLYDRFDRTERFVVLTCPAVGQVAAIHDRQPVILRQQELLPGLADESAAAVLLHRGGLPLEGRPVEREES